MEIPSGKTLTVPENTTLTVKDGVTLTNNGTITGNGTLDGEGNLVGSGTVANIIRNNLQKDSNVTVEVSSSPATYGSKVDIRATISKATNAITLAAENQNQVEFFVGTDSNKKSLGTAKVRGDAATLSDVEISQEKGFAVGENTITAEYGGSMGLKPQTGSTRLTVQGDLKDAIVTVNGEYFYTNSPITPEVSVTWNGTRLTKDADYTLAYTNHTNAGKATVTVTGTGNYTGTKTESFTIGKAKQAALSITGKPSTPIIYGQEFTLSADGGSGRGAVTWAVTSNPAYATVDNTGKVQITGVGAVAITATKAEDANYKETAATYDFTTQKAIPLVGTVSKTSPETIYPTTALADIALSRTNTTVAGTLALDADQTLSVGTNTYVWGTFGNVLTESLLEYKIRQYPDGVGNYEDFIRANWLNRRTTDCVGLIKGYGWLDTESLSIQYGTNGMPDYGANQMYQSAVNAGADHGSMSAMPEIVGLAVWKEGHIGVYIGGGYVIEAASTTKGVIKTQVEGRGWQGWCKIPYIDYLEEE